MPGYPQERWEVVRYRDWGEVLDWLDHHFHEPAVRGFEEWVAFRAGPKWGDGLHRLDLAGPTPARVDDVLWEFVRDHFGPEFNVKVGP